MTTSTGQKASGIDVSKYQQTIDWKRVATTGCTFAFIKATEGATMRDANFFANWAGAISAGIIRGPYHFFQPKTSVNEQVSNFLTVVKTLDDDDLPPVLDLETPADWTGIDQTARVQLIASWLNQVEKALNKHPILYMSPAFFVEVLGETHSLSSYPLWVAHYTSEAAPTVPNAWSSWTFWQYSDKGQVSGIKGRVDLDWFNGDILGLQKFISESTRTSD